MTRRKYLVRRQRLFQSSGSVPKVESATQSSLDHMSRQLAVARKRLLEARSLRANLELRTRSLERELDALRAAPPQPPLSALEPTDSARIELLKARLKEAWAGVADKMQADLEAVRDQLTHERERSGQLQEQVDLFELEAKSPRPDLSKEALEIAHSENVALKEELAHVRQRGIIAENAFDEVNKALDLAKEELQGLQAERQNSAINTSSADELARLVEERDRLRISVSELRIEHTTALKSLDRTERELQTAQQENDELSGRYEQQVRKHAVLTKRMSDAKAPKSEGEELQAALVEKEADLERARREVDQLRALLESSLEEKSSLQQKLETLEWQLHDADQRSQRNIQVLGELEALEAKLEALQDTALRLAEREAQLNELEGEKEALIAELAALQDTARQFAVRDAHLQELQGEKEALQGEKEALEAKLEALQDIALRLAEREARLQELQGEKEALEEKLEALQDTATRLAEREARLQELQGEKETLEEKLEALQDTALRLAEHEARLQELQGEKETLEEKLDAIQDAAQQLAVRETRLQELQGEKETLEGKLDAIQDAAQQLAMRETRVQELQGEKEALEEKLETFEKSREEAAKHSEEALDVLRESLSAANETIAELENSTSGLDLGWSVDLEQVEEKAGVTDSGALRAVNPLDGRIAQLKAQNNRVAQLAPKPGNNRDSELLPFEERLAELENENAAAKLKITSLQLKLSLVEKSSETLQAEHKTAESEVARLTQKVRDLERAELRANQELKSLKQRHTSQKDVVNWVERGKSQPRDPSAMSNPNTIQASQTKRVAAPPTIEEAQGISALTPRHSVLPPSLAVLRKRGLEKTTDRYDSPYVEALHRELERNPEDTKSRMLLVEHFVEEKNYDMALNHLEAVVPHISDAPNVLDQCILHLVVIIGQADPGDSQRARGLLQSLSPKG
ncbi:MAG: hypothetical protein AUK47_07145 [Deltaproteobacteria bacterium CG2_30_63_29]|nr:MAG: hypothetical protein AUK47_07145 [Deltaproteobacteria bacterium CG2_30_63_29]